MLKVFTCLFRQNIRVSLVTKYYLHLAVYMYNIIRGAVMKLQLTL